MSYTHGIGNRRSSTLGIVWLLLVSGAVAGAVEIVLRFGVGLGNPVLIIPDASCGYILRPDQSVRRFFVRTYINHEGMRSDEVTKRQRAVGLRLLFVGDSITYGTTRVDQNDIFTEVLHRELPAITHGPVEVLNASAGAWAIDNELSFIKSRGVYGSDIVLMVLNSGDLSQPRSSFSEVSKDLPSQRPATAIGEFIARYLRPRALHLLVQKWDAGDSVTPNASLTVARNLSDLDAAFALIQDAKAQMAVVYIPFRRDIPANSNMSEGILRRWCASHNVALLDLTAIEIPYSPAEITIDGGVHFNAVGNRIIARGIEIAWSEIAERRKSKDHETCGKNLRRQ